MGYLFLTGATGLLGSYLIRDLLRSGTKLAVLVRNTKFASAQHRIETQLAHWERQAGYSLPRPVVLVGDISEPGLGLDADASRWASAHCTALMHNAASLTFQADGPEDEPYRSNLQGTRHVLEFCRTAGIREFHHVSTAYVCGLRTDRCHEHELDVGQQFGNDYEVSKCEAEKLVRAADFITDLTVYRPAIITGDSQTGYTTTFHGFYVPLKLVSTLITKTAGSGAPREYVLAGIKAAGARLRQVLELRGDEQKNYVPVEWVSAAMAYVCTHPEHHGKTYHLTPGERVSVRLMQDVLEDAFLKYTEIKSQAAVTNVDWEEFEQMFIDGMNVYRSYWRDDPTFDRTNTEAALPHLPCPDMDRDVLMTLCRYAIESNFGWPRTPVVKPEFDLHEHLRPLTTETNGQAADRDLYLGLQVNGRGGGQWQLLLRDGRILRAEPGMNGRCTAMYYLNSQTFERLSRGEATAEQAIGAGRVLIEGNGVPLNELARLLQGLAVGHRTAAAAQHRVTE